MGLLGIFVSYMEKSFKDSLSVLEADIYSANTLASEYLNDGAFLQIRISYNPAASFLLFLVQWMDCRFAETLGLLRILIYKVYFDGRTTMSIHEKKASIGKFYAFILPTLMQLRKGTADMEDEQRIAMFLGRNDRSVVNSSKRSSDPEREEECEICMEIKEKFVIPTCNHCLCMTCFNEWKSKSQECPFCRSSLREVVADELWVLIERRSVLDMETVSKDNLRRFYVFIDRLPLIP